MQRQSIIAIVIILVIGFIVGGIALLLLRPQPAPPPIVPVVQPTVTPPSEPISKEEVVINSGEWNDNLDTAVTDLNLVEPSTVSLTPTPDGQGSVVTYTDTGFSPSVFTVKIGTTVIFQNTASGAMWVASNPHPIHTDYPEFDARRGAANGETYEFTFTKAGRWQYHNHLDSRKGGTIVVE